MWLLDWMTRTYVKMINYEEEKKAKDKDEMKSRSVGFLNPVKLSLLHSIKHMLRKVTVSRVIKETAALAFRCAYPCKVRSHQAFHLTSALY